MNFRQFAINNVVRNKRIYLAHFLSSTFSVMIFLLTHYSCSILI